MRKYIYIFHSSNEKDIAFAKELYKAMRMFRTLGYIVEATYMTPTSVKQHEYIKKCLEHDALIIPIISNDFDNEFHPYYALLNNQGINIFPILLSKTPSIKKSFLAGIVLFEKNIGIDEATFIDCIIDNLENRLEHIYENTRPKVRAGYNIFESSNVILKNTIEPFKESAFDVVGDSMEGEIREGDTAYGINILKDYINDVSRIGLTLNQASFYIVNSKEFGLVLKQIIFQNDELHLISLNKKYIDLIVKTPCDDILGIWKVTRIQRRYS